VSVAGRFAEVSDDDFAWLFGVNFWGVINGCRAFLPLLARQREAHIVNVCSSFAWLGFPGKSAYSSSKAAVRAFSESLRAELAGTPVGVTLLFPGPVATNLVHNGRAVDPQQRQREARFLQSHSLSPARVARRCLAGVRRNRARVLVGFDYRLIDLVARCAPSLALSGVAALHRRLPF
jgi:short-subunit dehydrogenase